MFATSNLQQICNRIDSNGYEMSRLCSLLRDGTPQGGPPHATRAAIAEICKLSKLAVCATDFSHVSESVLILNCRARTMITAVNLLDSLCLIPVNQPGNGSSSRRIMHAMIVPCQCLNFGFTYAASKGRVSMYLHSISAAVDYILQMFDEGLWATGDHLGDLMLELLIGGGTCIMDMCLCKATPVEIVAGVKQLLDCGFIQGLSCLICHQLSILRGVISSSPSHMLTTCFQFLFYCTRMLDFCQAGKHHDEGHRLAGPLTVEACKQIISRGVPDPCSLCSVTTPHILLTYAAGYDSALLYEGSSHTTPPLSSKLQKHLDRLPQMSPRALLRTLAWHAKDSPYLSSVLLAYHQEAHHWPHNGTPGRVAPHEDRVCCIVSSLLIIGCSARRFLQGILGVSRRADSGSTSVPPVPVIVDFSNYGFEFMALLQLTFQHIDELWMAPVSTVPYWQMAQLERICRYHVPILELEAFIRLWYTRRTKISAQLNIHQAVSLCLYLLCRHDAICEQTLPAFISLTNTVLKLVVCNSVDYEETQCSFCSNDRFASHTLGHETPQLCFDALCALQNVRIPGPVRCPLQTELATSLASLFTVSCAGIATETLGWAVAKIGELTMDAQHVVISFLTLPNVPEIEEQGAAWCDFASSRTMSPKSRKCGNWDCGDKSGCSEPALPTLLCAGCRKVRYCSKACQKRAWKKYRHASVCGM